MSFLTFIVTRELCRLNWVTEHLFVVWRHEQHMMKKRKNSYFIVRQLRHINGGPVDVSIEKCADNLIQNHFPLIRLIIMNIHCEHFDVFLL